MNFRTRLLADSLLEVDLSNTDALYLIGIILTKSKSLNISIQAASQNVTEKSIDKPKQTKRLPLNQTKTKLKKRQIK